MIAGYDPHRIARLEQLTRGALGSLDGLVSSDIAATGAIAAVRRLRAVLTAGFVPALAGIRATDPLAGRSTWFDHWLRLRLDRQGRTQFSDLGDIDLVVRLHIELTRQTEANGVPDPDDLFWTGEFHEWVAEFERRARTDPGFDTFMADEAAQNPMIGYIVAAGDFGADALIAVTTTLMNSPPNGTVYDTYRDGAIQALLRTITEQPSTALTLIDATDMTERLLAWNEHGGGAFGVDGNVIGAVFESALSHPFDDPDRMGEAHAILQQLVDLAHGPLFDRGFPIGTAPGITTGLIGYLPFLIDSLELHDDVFFEDSNGRFATRLGSSAAVVDLFGALMRDPSSRALLLATVPALAFGSESGIYDLDAVNNYVTTLIEAAETEQIEEEIHAERTRAEWNAAIGVVSTLLETAFTVGGGQYAIAQGVVHVVGAGARWLVDQIAADDLGMNDVHTTAFLLLTFGVSVAFLDRRRKRDDEQDDEDEDGERTAEARDLADEIGRLLDEGASREAVERQIRNLRRLIEEIGGDDALATLDDPRITPPTYDAMSDAVLAD